MLFMEPEGVRPLLFSNFAGIRIDGSNATIIGHEPGEFIADRNNIPRVWMDHGAWPFLTTRLYIDQTGDLGRQAERRQSPGGRSEDGSHVAESLDQATGRRRGHPRGGGDTEPWVWRLIHCSWAEVDTKTPARGRRFLCKVRGSRGDYGLRTTSNTWISLSALTIRP